MRSGRALAIAALAVALNGLACRDFRVQRGGAFAEHQWWSVIRGTAIARIAEADSAEAARLIDSIGPLAKTDHVALAGLVVALRYHRNAQIGAGAAWLLAQLGEEAVDPLVQALGAANGPAQLRAAYGLGEIGPGARRAMKPLIDLMSNESDSVAGMASWALGRVAPALKDRTVELIRTLRFGTGYPRQQAAYQAGWLGPAARVAFPILVRMLDDSSDQVREVASQALVRAGSAARPALESGLQSESSRVRVQAMMILNTLTPR